MFAGGTGKYGLSNFALPAGQTNMPPNLSRHPEISGAVFLDG